MKTCGQQDADTTAQAIKTALEPYQGQARVVQETAGAGGIGNVHWQHLRWRRLNRMDLKRTTIIW